MDSIMDYVRSAATGRTIWRYAMLLLCAPLALWLLLYQFAPSPIYQAVPAPNHNLPIPYGAHQLHTGPITGDLYRFANFRERTQYVTGTSPAAIRAYYVAALDRAGWKLDTGGSALRLDFGWQIGCPNWRLILTTTTSQGSATLVYLDLLAQSCVG